MHTDAAGVLLRLTFDRVILDLCGGSGSWSAPYREAEYPVCLVSLPTDVRLWSFYKDLDVHGILAAPPCTVFANSGARWERTEEEIRDALSIVDACLRIVTAAKPEWWVLENPVGKLTKWIGQQKMWFAPCDDVEPYTKKTNLWGNFTEPERSPVQVNGKNPIHHMSPGPERAAKRSITPPGFAQAFFEANP